MSIYHFVHFVFSLFLANELPSNSKCREVERDSVTITVTKRPQKRNNYTDQFFGNRLFLHTVIYRILSSVYF